MNRDAEIHRLRSKGAKIADLAARFNLSKARVSVICKTQAGLLAAGADMPARMEAAKLELSKWRAINMEHAATLAELRGRRLTGELISRDEVRDMFTRVFSSYRQSIRELDRRYGPEAALLVIEAERRALRVEVSGNDALASQEALHGTNEGPGA